MESLDCLKNKTKENKGEKYGKELKNFIFGLKHIFV